MSLNSGHQKSCVCVCARARAEGRVRARALHSHNISHPIYRRTLRQSMSANNEFFFSICAAACLMYLMDIAVFHVNSFATDFIPAIEQIKPENEIWFIRRAWSTGCLVRGA